jgi:hypothetical protein
VPEKDIRPAIAPLARALAKRQQGKAISTPVQGAWPRQPVRLLSIVVQKQHSAIIVMAKGAGAADCGCKCRRKAAQALP